MREDDPRNFAHILEDEARPGIELLTMRGAPGCEDETISVSNSLNNGLRIQILNDELDWAAFHFKSRRDAVLVAAKLLEWCNRMADPPAVKEPKEEWHPLPAPADRPVIYRTISEPVFVARVIDGKIVWLRLGGDPNNTVSWKEKEPT